MALAPVTGGVTKDDRRGLEIKVLRGRLSPLSDASLRINESLDIDSSPTGVVVFDTRTV